jgi:putative iron-dependent peroxidase
MLANMFLGRGAATHDRILDFSTAVTGSLFFVPSATLLDDLPGPPPLPEPAAAPPDTSLGVGSLRRNPAP